MGWSGSPSARSPSAPSSTLPDWPASAVDTLLFAAAFGALAALVVAWLRSGTAVTVLAVFAGASYLLVLLVPLFAWPEWITRVSLFGAFGHPYLEIPAYGGLAVLAGLAVIGGARRDDDRRAFPQDRLMTHPAPMAPEDLFAGHLEALATYEKVRATIDAIGSLDIRTSKSQVAFRRRRRPRTSGGPVSTSPRRMTRRKARRTGCVRCQLRNGAYTSVRQVAGSGWALGSLR